MFAKTFSMIKNAYNQGRTLYSYPTPKMNKIQEKLTRLAYRQGISAAAYNQLVYAREWGYRITRQPIVSMQFTHEDNDFYNKKLYGNKNVLDFSRE